MSKRDWPKKAGLTENDESQEAPPAQDGASSHEVEITRAELRETSTISRRGHHWQVIVIQEGWSKNDRYYTREALERSIPLWEGQDVCAYGYDPNNRNHVPEHIVERHPDGTYLNKVGFLKGVRGQVREGRYELVADFICTKADLRQELVETLEFQGRLPGFSIHAEGDTMPGVRDGRRGIVVTSITETKELTLVTHPAAGGQAFSLVAAMQNNNKEREEMDKLRKFLAGRLSARQPKTLAEAMTATVNAMDDKSVIRALAESLKEMDGGKYMQKALDALDAGELDRAKMVLELAIEMATPDEPPSPPEMASADEEPVYEQAPVPATVSEASVNRTLLEQLQGFEKRAALRECKALLNAKLAEAKLPKVAEDQLREQFGDREFRESELDKAIQGVNKLLAINAGGEARIERMSEAVRSNPNVQVLMESSEKAQLAVNILVGYDYSHLRESNPALYAQYKAQDGRRTKSIRKIYEDASGDYGCNRIGRSALNEAVSNTTFSNLLGDAFNLKLAQDFERADESQPWRNWFEEANFENLNAMKPSAVGGIGALPAVAEAADYTDLGEPIEISDTFSLEKKGGYVVVTEEAIINDRTGFIMSIPRKLREAAMENEDLLAYRTSIGWNGSAINGENSYDSIPFFDAKHFNYSTGALSHSELVLARSRQRKTRVPATTAILDNGGTLSNNATSVPITAANKAIRKDMILRVDSEKMLVTAVSGVTLTVIRGYDGTTAATHADASVLYFSSGVARWDGSLYIVAPTELEGTLLAILNSEMVAGGNNNDYNFLRTQALQGKLVPVVVDSTYLCGDVTNWYTFMPWQVIAGHQFGYYNGQRAPQLINETNEQVGQVFMADTNRYKVKHRIGAIKFLHEGSTGNIVSG